MDKESWIEGRTLDRIVAVKLGLVPERYHESLLASSDGKTLTEGDMVTLAYAIPHYSKSVDAALMLPTGDGVTRSIICFTDGECVVSYWKDGKCVGDNKQKGGKLALAIVKAWLSYVDSMSSEGESLE